MDAIRKGLAWAALLGATSGSTACASDDPHRSALENATTRWHDAGLPSYVYTYDTQCFCDAALVRVAVDHGAIVSFTAGDGLSHGNPRTVDDWFGYFERTLDGSPDVFSATYDDRYGYPKLVSTDRSKLAVDDELTFQVHCFEPSNAADACPLPAATAQ